MDSLLRKDILVKKIGVSLYVQAEFSSEDLCKVWDLVDQTVVIAYRLSSPCMAPRISELPIQLSYWPNAEFLEISLDFGLSSCRHTASG